MWGKERDREERLEKKPEFIVGREDASESCDLWATS